MPLIYKYRALGNAELFEQLESILTTGLFWYANATKVNDPFEFRCAVGLDWDLEKTAEAFARVEMVLHSSTPYAVALTKARTVLAGVRRQKLLERQ